MEQKKKSLTLDTHSTNIYHQAVVTTREFEGETLIRWELGFSDAARCYSLFSKNIQF